MELTETNTRGLLRLYADVLNRLRDKGIIRSTNNPVADYAEYLVARALNLDEVAKSTKGFDLQVKDGTRYQVKGRRLTPQNNSRQLSFIRGLAEGHFELLAGVLFNEDFSILKGCLIPSEVVMLQAKFVKHVNGWRLTLVDGIWNIEGVLDITPDLKAAEAGLE